MLGSKAKKESIKIHNEEVNKYDMLCEQFYIELNNWHMKKTEAVVVLRFMEIFINSIANTPKEFSKDITSVNVKLNEFEKMKSCVKKNIKNDVEVAAPGLVGAGAVVGAAKASAATMKSAMINDAILSPAIATSFGTSALGGVLGAAGTVATIDAAGGVWISFAGSSALAAGAGASTAWLGPVAIAVSAVVFAGNSVKVMHKNKKEIKEIKSKTIEIKKASTKVNEKIIDAIQNSAELENFIYSIIEMYKKASKLQNGNYLDFSDDNIALLCAIRNNTISLSELLTKTF